MATPVRPYLKFKKFDSRIGDTIAVPSYETNGASGMDLRACTKHTIFIQPDETILIPTGIAVDIEDPGLTAVLLPRSGLGHKHGIVLGNLVGIIDSDYQGQIFVSLWNRSKVEFEVKVGDRIAQLLVVPVIQVELIEVEDFVDNTDRGTSGFGSTGTA